MNEATAIGARAVLRAKNLCAGYGDREVLSGISFELTEGERLCVVGPNGSGKTTLLRVLAGTLPYRGNLLVRAGGLDDTGIAGDRARMVERHSLSGKRAAREIGFLAQLSSAYFPFTVAETVMLGRYARLQGGFPGAPTETDRRKVAEALAICGIGDVGNERLSRLSGGQLQRALLARAFAQDPGILLLDEPSNHLDLRYQLALLDAIAAWTRAAGDDGRARAAIGVFHDLSLASRFADSVILLADGKIADVGPPRAVLTGEAINRAYGLDVARAMRDLLQTW